MNEREYTCKAEGLGVYRVWRSLGGSSLIRGVLGVIVRVGRVCAIVVRHVWGLVRIHVSAVGRHEIFGRYRCRNQMFAVSDGFCSLWHKVGLVRERS